VLLVPILTVAMIRQRVSRDYLEGALIAYLAPIAYGLGLWIFLNWLIQGNAFYWLTPQTQAVPVGLQKRIDSTAAGWGPVEVVHQVVDVYWRIFPPTLIVFGALAVLFVLRRGRDMMLPTLGLILGVNAAFIAALVYKSQQAPNLQLRYNMRDMPLTLVAMGWIYLTAGSRWRRHAVWLACFAALLLAYPVTWQTMKTYPYQFLEQAFTRSVTQDRSQEGTLSIGWVFGKGDNFTVGIDDSLRMAAWVKRHNLPRNSVLTDDAQTFWTMLLSGRPDIFVDRIDQGDAHWLDLLDNPWGRVRYFLTTQNGDDKIGYRYPGIYRIPWAHLVHNEHKLALFRIDKRDHA
jgi:hypothetical protein